MSHELREREYGLPKADGGHCGNLRVRRLILLGGGPSSLLFPLSKRNGALAFPVLNKPLIKYTFEFAIRHGIEEVVVALSDDGRSVREIRAASDDFRERLNVRIYTERNARGTGGVLQGIKSLVGHEPFLVADASLFLDGLDVEGLVKLHLTTSAVATVVLSRADTNKTPVQSTPTPPDWDHRNVSFDDSVDESTRPWSLAGVYLFSPSVLDFIAEGEYLDIKEQLLPRLEAASAPIACCYSNGHCKSLRGFESYYQLHEMLLSNGVNRSLDSDPAGHVQVGANTQVSPSAKLVGPLVIGSGCTIGDGAQIIGPGSIGDNCAIFAGAVVRESILWNNTKVGSRARLDRCILGEKSSVREGDHLENNLIIDEPWGRYRKPASDGSTAYRLHRSRLAVVLGDWLISAASRLIDVVVALVLLVSLSPVFLMVSLAIVLDSSGPVLFRQTRCGKDGKDFRMLKFRTMLHEAHARQAELSGDNESDGPMFKMSKDPRITSVGRLLRKSSLDETPQLINVLLGEMSLVGPRPLSKKELRYCPAWRDIRLHVRPGLTGLLQVNGRSHASFSDWIRYDIEYVNQKSLLLDFRILLKTVAVVLRGKGAM